MDKKKKSTEAPDENKKRLSFSKREKKTWGTFKKQKCGGSVHHLCWSNDIDRRCLSTLLQELRKSTGKRPKRREKKAIRQSRFNQLPELDASADAAYLLFSLLRKPLVLGIWESGISSIREMTPRPPDQNDDRGWGRS